MSSLTTLLTMSNECPICYEEIQENEIKQLSCTHCFHKKCITTWCIITQENTGSSTCPCCRRDIRVICDKSDSEYSDMSFDELKEKQKQIQMKIDRLRSIMSWDSPPIHTYTQMLTEMILEEESKNHELAQYISSRMSGLLMVV